MILVVVVVVDELIYTIAKTSGPVSHHPPS